MCTCVYVSVYVYVYPCVFVSVSLCCVCMRVHACIINCRCARAAFLGTGVCVGSAGFITCEQRHLAVFVICLCLSFMGLNRSGYCVNHIDLAPRSVLTVSGDGRSGCGGILFLLFFSCYLFLYLFIYFNDVLASTVDI